MRWMMRPRPMGAGMMRGGGMGSAMGCCGMMMGHGMIRLEPMAQSEATQARTGTRDSAFEILRQRYARGEIDQAEYQQKRQDLRQEEAAG